MTRTPRSPIRNAFVAYLGFGYLFVAGFWMACLVWRVLDSDKSDPMQLFLGFGYALAAALIGASICVMYAGLAAFIEDLW